MRTPLLFPTLSFLGLIVIYLFVGKIPEANICDRCLYNSCNSTYLLLSCGEIQNTHIDEYFTSLRHVPDGMTRNLQYSQMYGKNMGLCFSESREYCRKTHCSSECKESDVMTINDNIVSSKDKETITKSSNYVIVSDSCYVRELNVEEMSTKCVLSPFRDDCTGPFSQNASRHCRM